MGQRHASTPTQRAQVVSQLLAHAGEYGVVTAMSQALGVSRQTLYHWSARGLAALEAAFVPAPATTVVTPDLERAVLTLLVEGHASYRGLQRCLSALGAGAVSLGTIAAISGTAQQRARAWWATQAPIDARPIALDELYGNDRGGGYLIAAVKKLAQGVSSHNERTSRAHPLA